MLLKEISAAENPPWSPLGRILGVFRKKQAASAGRWLDDSCIVSTIRVSGEWHLLKLIRVASGENVSGREAVVEPTRTYSRRSPEEVSRVGGSIAQR